MMENSIEVKFHTIEEAIEDMKEGKMVILVDDEDRENEGDLTMAAEKVTPEAINFMTKYGRGLVCLSMTPKRMQELQLDQMVYENTASFGTAFTVSVDAKRGVTTGISAADRAVTILTAIDPKSRPEDLARPGHVFPIRAREGGVLVRTGQTEGSVDLAKLAGLYPAGVICEIMNDDGTMARVPQLMNIAQRFDLKIVTIKDLIHYRLKTERLVRRAATVHLPTQYGTFQAIAFESTIDDQYAVAIVKGTPSPDKDVMVRVHSQCLTGDVFGSYRCDCGEQLHKSLEMIEEAGLGVIVYLHQEGRGIGLMNKMRAYWLQEHGRDTVQANEELGFKPDQREYGFGAQVLVDLGVGRMKLMTNNPKKYFALQGFGLEVVERVPIEIAPREDNVRYLKTKKDKLGHMLNNL